MREVTTCRTTPFRTIADMLTYSVPYTMALGGVATGSMKTREVDTAPATMRLSGSIPTAMPTAKRIGISMEVVAVFEVISESNFASSTTAERMNKEGSDFSSIRFIAM